MVLSWVPNIFLISVSPSKIEDTPSLIVDSDALNILDRSSLINPSEIYLPN